jgi:hypothetical protein
MCEKCNGTHVVHEFMSFGYRTSCCPLCGPVSDEEWFSRLQAIKEKVSQRKGAAAMDEDEKTNTHQHQ